jgi:hypothetical protein
MLGRARPTGGRIGSDVVYERVHALMVELGSTVPVKVNLPLAPLYLPVPLVISPEPATLEPPPGAMLPEPRHGALQRALLIEDEVDGSLRY